MVGQFELKEQSSSISGVIMNLYIGVNRCLNASSHLLLHVCYQRITSSLLLITDIIPAALTCLLFSTYLEVQGSQQLY